MALNHANLVAWVRGIGTWIGQISKILLGQILKQNKLEPNCANIVIINKIVYEL